MGEEEKNIAHITIIQWKGHSHKQCVTCYVHMYVGKHIQTIVHSHLCFVRS